MQIFGGGLHFLIFFLEDYRIHKELFWCQKKSKNSLDKVRNPQKLTLLTQHYSPCDETPTQFVTKLQNSNCENNQTLIVTKLNSSNCDNTEIVTKTSYCDKTPIVTKLKM